MEKGSGLLHPDPSPEQLRYPVLRVQVKIIHRQVLPAFQANVPLLRQQPFATGDAEGGENQFQEIIHYPGGNIHTKRDKNNVFNINKNYCIPFISEVLKGNR